MTAVFHTKHRRTRVPQVATISIGNGVALVQFNAPELTATGQCRLRKTILQAVNRSLYDFKKGSAKP